MIQEQTMAKRPTKKQQAEEIERKRQAEILKNNRRESKFQLITNVSRLRDTLRKHKLLMRQVSLYLQAGQGNYKQIQEIADKVQAINNELEEIIEYKPPLI